ncbi:transmembrane protein 231 [Oratosquilla oratoria]|uniref:transmembrane protein 231 n=1 Tax=Oratosquilla oratoria TaxID=337810 RepID=UPI003F7588E9
MLFEIYKLPIFLKYRAPVFSATTFIYILINTLTIISPLIIIFRTRGLWKEISTQYEQPDVHFKHGVLLLLDTNNGPLVWSTFPNYNAMLDSLLRIPVVKTNENDVNYDGTKDELSVEVVIPLEPEELVYSVSLLLTFDVQLHHICEVALEGLAHFQYSSGLPGSAISFLGDLSLHQRMPLPSAGHFNLFDVPVLPYSSVQPEDWKVATILQKYWKRDVTSQLSNLYSTWQGGIDSNFTIIAKLHYAKQNLSFYTTYWEMLKFAWIQYLALFVISYISFQRVIQWLITNQVIQTWCIYPKKDL